MSVRILTGDCREVLRELPSGSVHCVVTSPPYWGLRDYGTGAAGIGVEPTLPEHLAALVEVFAEVRRVLRDDGVMWVNYGDAYAGQAGGGQGKNGQRADRSFTAHVQPKCGSGLKRKDLIGLPWRLAFALQDDGWWLRSDCIWAKPNPMPESVTDRPTRAHEYVFLLSKSASYWYDAAAVRMPDKGTDHERTVLHRPEPSGGLMGPHTGIRRATGRNGLGANLRTVWNLSTALFPDAHFATFPPALAERCIKAGCPQGGVVLDPFGGAGTTGLVADRLQRDAILIELNPDYAAMARERIAREAGLFAKVDAA